ncbi:hypothetical protein [Lactonifactor longoviformis]|uniref:Uncharacterized protein n=1 Tax=Lactonifactor longoviformis DSM 17459 TaxID=1122155 RepID=A0A1M5CN82_9CLOT|nr:hypothetical protein [Lactonifactor longoviformis]SHF56169.1 hypothetical protein SAMN02745158_04218 [Lactonifactor longoviformis DSM 17459]
MMEINLVPEQSGTDCHRSNPQEVVTEFPKEMDLVPGEKDDRPRKDGPGGE